MTITALLVFLSPTLSADDVGQLNMVETKEKWGQVLFCQRIYQLEEVKSRLYDFDIEQCNQAGQLIADGVTSYSKQEQEKLKYEAERHSTLLSLNTKEPYQAVPACREYCRAVVEALD